MKYQATIEKKNYLVEIESKADQLFAYTVAFENGAKRELDIHEVEPNVFSLLIDGVAYEVLAEEKAKGYEISLGGHTLDVKLIDDRLKSLLNIEPEGGMAGEAVVESPMPGKVIALKKKVGDTVTEGEGVVVVEAMKMENELNAPKSGKIKSVEVKEGQTVEANQKLLVIE